MGVIATLLLVTAIAGIVGTGLGGLLGAILQKDSNRTVSLLLSFAGGVMLSVVCFDLVVEAIETNVGIWIVIGSIALGVAVIHDPLGDDRADAGQIFQLCGCGGVDVDGEGNGGVFGSRRIRGFRGCCFRFGGGGIFGGSEGGFGSGGDGPDLYRSPV